MLAELLEVREEKATLLGYADWPSYDAEVKMIGEGAPHPRVHRRDRRPPPRKPDAARSRSCSSGRAPRARTSSTSPTGATTPRRSSASGSASTPRRCAATSTPPRCARVCSTSRVASSASSYEPVDAPTWHPEVSSYDVRLAENRQLLGRIHLDLHPRPRKYNHAAQFTLVPGVLGRQLPEGVLVCNFSRGLMELDHVVTLFHEFGHLMHHVLAGRHEWVRFSGVATEWDFVEAPSQMLEEWAWDPGVLRTFATDAHGEPIPEDLVRRMRAADEFGKGFLTRTQMAYAAISYWFHQERPADLTARLGELFKHYGLVELVPDTHFHTGFGHLDDYGSAYYTYAWSLVIAKDLFSAFDPDDLFAPEVAHRYRDTVLAPGGSKDAADLVDRLPRSALRQPCLRAPGSRSGPERRRGGLDDRGAPGAAARRPLRSTRTTGTAMLRTDEPWLDERWADPATRVLVIAGARVRPVDGRLAWVSPQEAPDGLARAARRARRRRALRGDRRPRRGARRPRRVGGAARDRAVARRRDHRRRARSCCTRSGWPSGSGPPGTARGAAARSSPGRPDTCCTARAAAATSSRAPTRP